MQTAIRDAEIDAFVGPRAYNYRMKWPVSADGERVAFGFNWAACLLSGFWLPYRKMYRVGMILYGLILAESVAEEIFFVQVLHWREAPAQLSRAVGLAVAITCGALGNRWYLAHTTASIRRLRNERLNQDQYFRALSRSGGPNILAAIGMFVMFLLAAFSIFFVLGFFEPAN